MTIHELNRLTADMPGETEIKILAPWGEIADAALVTPEDLEQDDPVRESFPPNSILLCESAD